MTRPSTSSDRLHLLAQESALPSPVPSRAPSLSHKSSTTTLKATQKPTQSPSSPTSSPARFKSSMSEAEYLSLLRAWVEEKQYTSVGDDLPGFYGSTTMDMYAAKPGPPWQKQKKRTRNEITPGDLDCNGRRRTIAVVAPERRKEESKEEARRRSVWGWLGRR